MNGRVECMEEEGAEAITTIQKMERKKMKSEEGVQGRMRVFYSV